MTGAAGDADRRAAYRRTSDEVVKGLGTDGGRGLSEAEARARLDKYGRNELAAEKPVPGWRKFLAQFEDTLVILLLVAAAVSAGVWLHERASPVPYEALAILSIVLLNAAMGYAQIARAEKAVAALRAMTAAEATVVRDGERSRVPAAEIVPGDIVLVEEGDTVPADGRLIETTSLQTAEAALTGESQPVTKDTAAIADEATLGDRRNMIFTGTAVTYGRGKAVAVATGMETEMGQIAGMLKAAPEEITPLQKELDRTGKMLGWMVVIIAAVVIATIVVVQHVSGLPGLLEVLILGVALAVAAVPEGLPAIVTVVLSLGVQRMARRNVIVRRLSAVETLGSANVVATDKTGTLTRNEMTVRTVATASGQVALGGSGYSPEGETTRMGAEPKPDGATAREVRWALTAGGRANNARLQKREGRWVIQGDPTEAALLVAAAKAGLDGERLEARFRRRGEIPFSSERKLMSTIDEDAERPGGVVMFTKGAPDVLLGRCSRELRDGEEGPLSEERRAEILRKTEELAGEALRTLGVAYRRMPAEAAEAASAGEEGERDLVFAGLIGMIDPPREEAKAAVARAKAAGVRPIMITGDHPKTAEVIARELGITGSENTVTGAELGRMSGDELLRTVRKAGVYARVNPGDKLRIVGALQGEGDVVAMTGDGVNDAPALKKADIGVAMGITGTDVTKEVADMILTDDNFASIVAAVEEGRAIFSNIRKFLRYLLSSNIGEVMTMFFGVALAGPLGLRAEASGLALPVLATQILWINLLTDGAPALALGLDPADAGGMRKPPRPRGEGVITASMWRGIFFVGAVMAGATLLVLDASLPGGLIEGTGGMRYARTMAFTTLVLAQLFNAFNARSDVRSAFAKLFTNGMLWMAVGVSMALQLAVVYAPFLQKAFSTVGLSAGDWAECGLAASSVLWLRELSKWIGRRRGGDV